MVQIKKKKDLEAKIPDAGMSDIVFLLLLFFLVSTTIDVDTGIGMSLPEFQEEQEFVPISKERLVTVNINKNGDVLLNGDVIAIPQISENLKDRIVSKIELPSNKKLIVSIKTDRRTNYNLYIQALDQIVLAYSEVQETYSQQFYGKGLADLTPEEKRVVIKEKVPKIISIAEPEKIN
ncbi:MAG: biopolymer transporter ExbD [Melioribacteraceae bacterium]|jgi:biopolymer transport protein ExbD|nr:biopolymer transporter ExbD [Melioribacteraceae bacterium]